MQFLIPMNTLLQTKLLRNSKGFTLIELIMVIILLSIVGMVGGNFIAESFRGFAQSENRIDIYEEGKLSLVRMEREIHNAIPNAFNLASATDIQFGMMDERAMRTVFGQYTNNNPKKFIRDRLSALPLNSIISIYNTSWADFTTVNTPRLYEVNLVTGTKMDIDDSLQDIQAGSPNKRYYAVEKGIRYCLDGTTLRRDSEPINGNYQTWYPARFSLPCSGRPLATNVTSLNFRYFSGSSTNSPLVSIDLAITRNGENINFHKEVMIVNVP